jgi:hypothetical protein
MRIVLCSVLFLIVGWFIGEGIQHFVKTTKTEAYLEGCILAGGDPIKCLSGANVYLKK